jgi:cytochrome c oxidase assembly factor CtaG
LIAAFAIFETDAATANFWAAWSFPVLPFLGLTAAMLIYLRGWRAASATRPQQLPPWRAASFVVGIASLWVAIASPIDALDDYLLTAHMIQHFILMSIAPPLIVLGAPTVPLLRGLPKAFRPIMRPLFRARWLHRLARFFLHPVCAWLLMNIAYLGWHVPALFELTFRSEAIHQFEHACFFMTSVVFWWVVLAPWPAQPVWPRWAIIPYLLSADILNTILSAVLTFSGRVLYPSYLHAERICRLTALQDQIAAGAEMWVLNSTVFLVPAVALTFRLLTPKALRAPATGPRRSISV